MEKHPTDMNELLTEFDKLEVGKPKINFSTYDYQALVPTIVYESFWVIQLESMGFVDEAGRPVDPYQARGSSKIRPTFIVYCYDDKGAYRLTHGCTGLPDSKTILL